MSNNWCVFLVILVKITAVLTYRNATVDDQLSEFAASIQTPAVLTTSYGAPVLLQYTTSLNRPRPLSNHFFMESLMQMNRERIPERIVHAKGAGAFGYFYVTHDLKHICKAKVFEKVGKRTPLVARFSTTVQRIGGSDMARDIRGFALKLYTEEGNLDFLNLNVDMFQMKDAIFFPTFVHSSDRNPRTNLVNPNAFWDFLTLRPESLSMYMRFFGDHGIPAGYRHMLGWTIHTYELKNSYNNKTFARFHLKPDAELKNLTTQQAQRIQAEDLDYHSRGLYEDILNKNYPSWTFVVQLIAESDVSKVDFDIFDITRYWSTIRFPLQPIGKVVLNKNPDNFFADIEQAAFNPGNLVPGINGIDVLFETRSLIYMDGQLNRLGKNYNRFRVNCPLSGTHTYYKDGTAPVHKNGGGAPTYYPNSYKGPMPLNIEEPPLVTPFTDNAANNFDQIDEVYSSLLNKDEKCRLVENIVASLSLAEQFLQNRAVNLFKSINKELGHRIQNGLKKGPSKKSQCKSL